MLRYSELEPRPPYEASSVIFEISTGCSQAVPCNFCSFYTKSFSLRPIEEIEAELDEVATWPQKPRRAFLQSGNAFGIPADRLISILELIREKLPWIQTFGGFTRVDDVRRLSDEQLAKLAALGASDLSIGAESGLDETLEALGKVHRAADITEQCARLTRAGITYTLWYIAGSARAGRCLENARVSAEIYSQAQPKRIFLTTLSVGPNTPLGQMVESGEYELSSDYETVQEIREFLAGITCPTIFDCGQESNLFQFRMRVPEGRDEILAGLDGLLAGSVLFIPRDTDIKHALVFFVIGDTALSAPFLF